MERVLAGLHWETLLVYLDDVIVFAKTLEEELDLSGDSLPAPSSSGLEFETPQMSPI